MWGDVPTELYESGISEQINNRVSRRNLLAPWFSLVTEHCLRNEIRQQMTSRGGQRMSGTRRLNSKPALQAVQLARGVVCGAARQYEVDGAMTDESGGIGSSSMGQYPRHLSARRETFINLSEQRIVWPRLETRLLPLCVAYITGYHTTQKD
jgi:hypothetical protein